MKVLGAFAVAATTLFAAPVTTDQQTSASCAAPTVRFRPTQVVRGSGVTITGRNFGDDCFDTGAVPEGLGPLGTPLSGLAIVINQGEREFLVATGAADSDYAFQVEIVVPVELEPGEAFLSLMGGGDARLPVTPALVVSRTAPRNGAVSTVTTFGPQPTVDTAPPATVAAPILPTEIPDENVATVPVPLSTAPLDDPSSDTDEQRRIITVGIAVTIAVAAIGFAFWTRSNRRRW